MKIGIVMDTFFSGVNEVVSSTYYTGGLYSHKLFSAAFLKLWSADHKWSLGSALVVLLD